MPLSLLIAPGSGNAPFLHNASRLWCAASTKTNGHPRVADFDVVHGSASRDSPTFRGPPSRKYARGFEPAALATTQRPRCRAPHALQPLLLSAMKQKQMATRGWPASINSRQRKQGFAHVPRAALARVRARLRIPHARRAGALLLSAMKQKQMATRGWPFVFVFLAERGGFEPPIGYEPIHAFQACDLNHSSISPDGVSCVHEAAYYNKVSLLYKTVLATVTT